MENLKTFRLNHIAKAFAFTSIFALAPNVLAGTNDEPEKETTSEEQEVVEIELKDIKKEYDRQKRYKRVVLSEDKETYVIEGREEEGEKPVDGETFYVKYKKKKNKNVSYRIKKLNQRDGFFLAYSAISSTGDDIYDPEEKSATEFDAHFSYRIQLLGFFVEQPGLSSRRLHGLYASNAWGFNFYNNDNWSLDLFKQFNTEKVEGLAQVQNRNDQRRSGIRATGYYDNSQLQFILSPDARGSQAEDGIEASVSYTHYWQVKNWNIYGSLGAQYQSKEVLSYGQTESETAQSRVNTSAELGLEYALNEDWVLGAFASYNELPSQDSTVDANVNGTRAGVLLSFVF